MSEWVPLEPTPENKELTQYLSQCASGLQESEDNKQPVCNTVHLVPWDPTLDGPDPDPLHPYRIR